MNQIEDESTNSKFASLFDLIADKTTQTVRVDQIYDLVHANTGSGDSNEPSPVAIYFEPLLKNLPDNERSAVLSKADFVRRFAPSATHQTPMPSSTLTPMSVSTSAQQRDSEDASVVPTKLHFDDDTDAQMRNSVQQLRAQVATLTESLGAVSEQLSLEKLHHARSEATVREMQQENAQAEQRAATLVKEAKALSHALDTARQRVEELEEALRNAELLRADEGQRAATAAKKADLRHQAVLAEVMMVRQSFANAEIDCLNSRKLLDGANAANEALTADNDALRGELVVLQERCLELEASVHLLKDENARINEEFALTRRSSDQLSRRESTNPTSAMSTPAATPARAGLFQSPATPAGSVIGTLRPALLDELVQAMPSPAVAPQTLAANDELVAALKSLQSLYSRSVAHGEQLSLRIGEASAQRDDEVAAVRAQLRRVQQATPTRVIVQSQSHVAWNTGAALLVAFALYFGMCVNAYAASTAPGFRDSWPS